ncbi:MAG: hypothetical protein AB8B85_05385 [Paracoccaceae bacterium]
MSDTVITRIYSNEAAANSVADALRGKGFREDMFDVISGGSDSAELMSAAKVGDAEAAVYGPMVGKGNALVVVRAPFTPFGAVASAKSIVAAGSPLEVEVENADRYTGDGHDSTLLDIRIQHGFWGDFLIGHLVPGHKFMAKWPFDHLVPGHKFMAKFPFAHLVPGHKFMAKFPFAHIVPGHKFMAKFPFAHLVPGHKFMAKFPFGHIVPGHKFMAKFPFDHIVPDHKYMANWIWPHTKAKGN